MYDDFDPSGLTALVFDDNHFERRISIDQLRAMGFGRAMGAADHGEAWQLLLKINPDVVLVDWIESINSGLDFVRKVRTSPEAPNRALSIFMLTSRGRLVDVESARAAGVDGYLRKPVSGLALKQRVRAVVTNPQPFIVTESYVGPCRRRRQDPDYQGPWRRASDAARAAQADGETDEGALRARACVAALEGAVRAFSPAIPASARKVSAAAQDLCALAESIEDADLLFGARELVRYLQASPAAGRLDAEVLHTHAAALSQLAHLSRNFAAERQRMARGLKRMIDKKLRGGASAA